MNFMSSLKTIVNQHVTIAEFNVVKNMISGYDNQIKDIMNKNNNYDITINNIQDNIKRMKNEINNKNINQSGIDEPKSSNSKENDIVDSFNFVLCSLKIPVDSFIICFSKLSTLLLISITLFFKSVIDLSKSIFPPLLFQIHLGLYFSSVFYFY